MPNNTHPLNGLTATIVHDELTSYTMIDEEIASRLAARLEQQQPRQGFVVEPSAQRFFNVRQSLHGAIYLIARGDFSFIDYPNAPVRRIHSGMELHFREDDAGGLRYNAHLAAVERFGYTPQRARLDPRTTHTLGAGSSPTQLTNAANWLSQTQLTNEPTKLRSRDNSELVKTLQHDNALLAKQVVELQAKLKELGHE